MEYPDQKLFEPEPDDGVEDKPFIPTWARILGTTLAIVGLVYLSGVHQGFLFRRTPPSAESLSIESELNEEALTLPLQVFVLVGGANMGSLRTGEDVDQMVRNASSIWNQADISLIVGETNYIELTDIEINAFLGNPGLSIPNFPGYDPAQINVFLTRSLSGINGIAFGGLRSTAVADFTTINDFRTFAHEVGHVLGLDHTQDRSRLMAQGTNGVSLTHDEVSSAREIAKEFGYEYKKKERRKRAVLLSDQLAKLFPDASIALKYRTNWELLVSVILSAQCTDIMVNKVTRDLFKKYKTLNDYVKADIREFEKDIKRTGFYRNKAKNILSAAKMIQNKHKGRVPKTMEDILLIPGVARKTANVVLGNAYGIVEGIAVDTHVRRFARKFDLTDHKDPVKIERDLMELFPQDEWFSITYRLIEYGRQICPARRHDCKEHPLSNIYPKAAEVWPMAK